MIIKYKRLVAFMITLIIIASVIFAPLSVSAYDKGVKPTTEWSPSEWVKICYYLGSKIGLVGDAFGDAVSDWCSGNFTAEGLKEKFDAFKAGVSVKNGKVLISTDAMNALKIMTDSYLSDSADYWYEPTYKFSDLAYLTGNYHYTVYNYLQTLLDDPWHFIQFMGSTSDYFTFFEISVNDVYFVAGTGSYENCLYFADLNGDSFKLNIYYVDTNSSHVFTGTHKSSSTIDYACVPSSSYNFYKIVTRDGHAVKVWRSRAALRNYLRGISSSNKVYVSSVYNNYNVNNDNSLEINNEILNEYIFNDNSTYTQDVSQVVNNITNVVNNYYTTNGSSMTQADIQAAIDAALQKFYDSLPSGGGTTDPDPDPDPDNPGGDVSGNDPSVSSNDVSGNGVDGPVTVSLLRKILNKLTEFFDYVKGGFTDILHGIRGDIQSLSGNSISGNGVSGNGTADPEVKSWLEKIYDKLKEIKWAIVGDAVTGGLGDLLSVALDKITDLADSVKDTAVSIVPEIKDMVSDIVDGTEETIGKMVGNVGTSMRPVGNLMKTKFPFSVPWDIAAVVGSLSAAPETPVFEIPIVFERYDIDYTLTIDMTDYEVISKISRLFLSLTFVLFLTKLTITVVKMEKEL